MFPQEKGLSEDEVKQKQAQYGLNILPEEPPPGVLSLIFDQIKSPLVYILILATLITLIVGHLTDAIIISLAVVMNTTLGFIQERRASRALFALRSFLTNTSSVLREGQRQTVNSDQIVPGDTVILKQGDKVPADGKLTFVNRLNINEAVLTGESLPVSKESGEEVFMGSTIATGQALMVVTDIGSATKMGEIAHKIQQAKESTPLQRQINTFGRQLVIVILVLTSMVFFLGLFYRHSFTEIFLTSVALAVAAIPEGLPISLTVVLAIGMQRILKHRGLVRKLVVAETLGGVSVICVDKTGTLTEGKMSVTDVVGKQEELAEQVLLANDLDDPIVIAAFAWGRTILKDFVSEHPRLDSIPFSSSERVFMSLHTWQGEGNRLYVNGAPERVLEYSTLNQPEKEKQLKILEELTAQGKRVIGYGQKIVPKNFKKIRSHDGQSGLTFVGLLAFSDPVRVGVKDALAQARRAGIKIKVVTGDYPKTAEFVLAELGMKVQPHEILLGSDLKKSSPSKLSLKVKTIRLFARTTPEQKLAIVEALKSNGEIVAMMGDGVNDAPALHEADIGMVVGEATDVAQESADMVLLDSNFATIVKAVEEGRGMFENIRKIILYLLCDAFAEILLVFGSLVLGLPLPMTAVQILWINLVADGFPGLALTVDPKTSGLMKRKPRDSAELLVNSWMRNLIAFVSLVVGMLTLGAFLWVYGTSGNIYLARSMAFICLGLCTLIYVFSLKELNEKFRFNDLLENKWLLLGVLAGFGLLWLPFMNSSLLSFFGLVSLPFTYWLTAVILSLVVFVLIEIYKLVVRWVG